MLASRRVDRYAIKTLYKNILDDWNIFSKKKFWVAQKNIF